MLPTFTRAHLIGQAIESVLAQKSYGGLDEVQEEYVAFLDYDDTWTYCHLAELVNVLEQNPHVLKQKKPDRGWSAT